VSTPWKIVVTSHPRAVIKPLKSPPPPHAAGSGIAKAKIRHRYRAEFASGAFAGKAVEGFPSSDEAIGALIRETLESLQTHDELFQFVSGLFGDLDSRTADETMGRAIRFASRDPRRRSAGVNLVYQNPEAQAPRPAAQSKGGAA
jgi:hypothetical protein